MLEEQYRMHPEIAAFPSSHVYNNCLTSHRLDTVDKLLLYCTICEGALQILVQLSMPRFHFC